MLYVFSYAPTEIPPLKAWKNSACCSCDLYIFIVAQSGIEPDLEDYEPSVHHTLSRDIKINPRHIKFFELKKSFILIAVSV